MDWTDETQPGRARRARRTAAAVFGAFGLAVTATAWTSTAVAARADGRPAGVVYDTSRDLALAAARERLPLLAADASGIESCALITPDDFNVGALAAATTPETIEAPPMALDLDPWTFSVAVDQTLRPDAVAEGEIGGTAVARCAGDRPASDTETRAEVFTMLLAPGVTFGEVADRYGVDDAAQIEPARIGGLTTGACQAATSTAVCVALWHDGDLVVGTTLTGPPNAVDPWSSTAMLNAIVPDVLDGLAVITGAPATCDAATIAAATGVTLIEEPVCHAGWALGRTVVCPPPPPVESTPPTSAGSPTTTPIPTTTIDPATDPCNQFDVFHVEPGGWVSDGTQVVLCAEQLVGLGMGPGTATLMRPACDPAADALARTPLAAGAEGAAVRALQIALIAQGYRLPLDSRYGPVTESAVIAYQQAQQLDIDGAAGPKTQDALEL